jgi:lipopolysaccharide/colanic/teichoic acid biosynthesis glycosyltransferase
MSVYEKAKRLIDVVASVAGMMALAPLLGVVAACIRVTMGSPVFFRQQRAGQGGKTFDLLKFRTMRHPRTEEDAPEYDAARLTRLGRWLRTKSVDEFPTLWNVLCGDMSLVGPRPLPVRYLGRYTRRQARRHEVKPGITGWAQINGRNAIGWEEKFALDVEYVENRSLLWDLEILARTVWKVLRAEGINQQGHASMCEFLGCLSGDMHDP